MPDFDVVDLSSPTARDESEMDASTSEHQQQGSDSASLRPGDTTADTAPDGRMNAVFRRLSWHLVPVFFTLNLLNYLDRTNVAFASIQMKQDLNFSAKEYGIGAGLFFVGYSVCQIPSQVLLRRIGPPTWLAIIVSSWGVIAVGMAFIETVTMFYIARLLLGVAESGSFPGYWYYLTLFYPDQHITIPYVISDAAIMVAQVVGAPVAAGLLHLNGTGGLLGWQWLFIAEGIPTLILGLSMRLLLPRTPRHARCLSLEESAAVEQEVQRSRGSMHTAFSDWDLFRQALQNKRIWLMGLVKFSKDMTFTACLFWTPLLIQGLLDQHKRGGGSATDGCEVSSTGEAKETAPTGVLEVLLTGIPYTFAVLGSLCCGWNSQRTGDRRYHIGVCYIISGIILALLPILSNASFFSGFIALILVIALSLSPNGPLLAKATAKAQGPSQSFTLALFNSVGNLSGLFGPVILGMFKHYTCSYSPGFVLLGIVLVCGGVLALSLPDDLPEAAVATSSGTWQNYVELPKVDGPDAKSERNDFMDEQ